MRFSLLVPSAAFAIVLSGLASQAVSAQTFAADTGTEAVISAVPSPETAKVSVPGHHKHAAEKLLFGRVRDGVYTVDGMVAKVQLNYDVNGVGFLYLFVPGIGTAVVSAMPDPNAVTSEAVLKGNELSFSVGEHRFNLTGVALASNKGTAPAHLYARLDRAAWRLGRQPMVGFGDTAAMPYQWPGALHGPSAPRAEESEVIPPVPANLLPSITGVSPRAASAAPAAPADAVSLRPVALP